MPIFPAASTHRHLFGARVLGFLCTAFVMAEIGNIGKHVFLFSLCYLLGFLFLFGMLKHFPAHWTERQQWIVILGLSIVVRFAFLSFPASDDTCRYIWEGTMLNKGYNPFIYPPDSPVLAPFIDELYEIWGEINHKDASGCYPPLSMLLFRLAAWISPTKHFFNLLVLSFDLATVVILMLLLRFYRMPLSRVLLFALNPLVLVFIAGEGHLDAIQSCFIWLGFYTLVTQRHHLGFGSFGCAVMSKYFAVIFPPFLVKKKNWAGLAALFVVMVLLYLPFWGTGTHFFTSLKPFGLVMHYNDSLTVILRGLFGQHATLVCLGLLSICFATIFLTVHDPLKSSYLAAASVLLLLSTLHPWYLTLLTPFLVFFPSRAWLYLHAAMACTFPVMHHLYYSGVFQEIHWIKWIEYLPFYGLLLWDTLRKTPFITARRFQAVTTLSVIIPTLNEAQHLRPCLETLSGNPALCEILVSDGGSTDGTCGLAEQLGARVLHAPKGRGHQIRIGVLQARGDVILILHADCVLARDIPGRLLDALRSRPDVIGGSVGMKYADRSASSRLVEWLNNSRARWTGIAFGDQVQFFRQEALSLIGGFPAMMLMEDVELSMRLKEQGSLHVLSNGVVVSNRRWTRIGFRKNVLTVLWFCVSFLAQRRLGIGDRTGNNLYKRYYSTQTIE